jgi:hypothetical protein
VCRRGFKVVVICLLLFTTWSMAYAETVNHIGGGLDAVTASKRQVLLIDRMFQMQKDAVNKRDEQIFVSTLHLENSRYIKEAKNWFRDAIQFIDPGSYELRVVKVRALSLGKFKVTLKQSYKKKGKRFHLTFTNLVIRDQGKWLDSDIFFYEINRDNVLVKFNDPSLEKMANDGAAMLNRSVLSFRNKLGWTPHYKLELKLYKDLELFRQSVKLSLPEWAVGWNEYGESIKFIGDTSYDKNLFSAGLQHEATHQMLGEMTNDNAAYWMHEGLATYYEMEFFKKDARNKEMPKDKVKQKGTAYESPQIRWTLEEMMKVNLEELNSKEAKDYYYEAYLVIKYFINHYGEDVLINWMAELRKFPYVSVTTAEKLDSSNKRTLKAFEKATGESFRSFADAWNEQFIRQN